MRLPRHTCFFAAALILMLPLAPAGAGVTGEDLTARIDPRLLERAGRQTAIVLLHEHASFRAGVGAARDAGIELGSRYQAVNVFVGSGTRDQLAALSAHPSVQRVDANEILELHTETSHRATRGQEVLDRAITTRDGTRVDGRGVGIAIVDTGVDGTHDDLKNRMGGNIKIVCSTLFLIGTVGEDPNPDDCLGPKHAVEMENTDHVSAGGHGTHVAGIVAGDGSDSAGRFHGAAPGATIYGVGAGSVALRIDMAFDALNWVLENHDKVDPPIKVVNASWGSTHEKYAAGSSAIWRLQEALIKEGITFVQSAGNKGGDGSAPITGDGCVNPTPGVICVANYDDLDTGSRAGSLSVDSSRGASSDPESWPDVSAPGSRIVSTCSPTLAVCWVAWAAWQPNHNDPPTSYALMGGTSMAAPHVTGIVAQLLQVDPTLTPAEIEDVIEDTAHKFEFGGEYTADPFNADDSSSFDKGHGLVDVFAAINKVCRFEERPTEGSELCSRPPEQP